MVKAQQEADANYNTAMEEYNAQVAEAEETLNAWTGIYALMNGRKRAARERQEAEQRERDKQLHDEAVAQVEEQKRIAAEKAKEQETIGTHAVNPKIKEKWDRAAKVEGNPNALTLADGSTLRGHYVLTEAGAASASHDINNAFEPTEGFPIDENGESVNDRDYKRDTDAQQIVRDIARNYDSRALQPPVIVSKDGIVLSGNNRTMSGDMAAQQGTDKAYIDHLREFGQMYGFTPEQIDGMKHPRVVFVPDEELPYDAATFARFNAEQQKKQSKPEQAVKLGKVVPDNVFNSIVGDISRYDRLSDYYADDKAVASAISQLLGAGVINEMQLPEMRTGNALSAAGRELIENTLIGKVFQSSPDAVRHIIGTSTLRQSVVMGLNEIAHNRTLAKSGYDLSQELGAAVDLVARARSVHPDVFKDGMPVSPFGREQGLFDDEYGDSRVTDGLTLMLADILNSGKPSELRKFLSVYNNEAASPAGGQLDMFSGKVTSKEELLNRVTEYFRNATPREQQAIVDAAVAERKQRAEAAAQVADGTKRDGENPSEAAAENGSVGLRNDGRGRVEGHSDQRQGDLAETWDVADNGVSEWYKNLRLSGELDQNNSPFILSPNGQIDFGQITEAHHLPAAPIRLSMGDMTNGYIHINRRHGKQIQKAGFDSIEAFVDYVVNNFTRIKEGASYENASGGKNNTYLIQLQDGHNKTLFVQLSRDGKYWNVNSAGVFGKKYGDKKEEIWSASEVQNDNSAVASDGLQSEPIADNGSTSNGTPSKNEEHNRHTTAKQPAETAETSQGTEQSDTQEPSSMNVPTSSDGKDINKQTTLQENGGKSSENKAETPLSEQIATASAEVDTEPTEAQKEAGNYKKGHVQVGTFDITIEQPQGSVRKGTDALGKKWESKMHNTYGYFRGTEGVDGDHIDVFLSNDIDGWNGRKVYVVDQYNPDGTFDEHKVMLGFNDADEAKSDYLANYKKGWEDGRRIVVSATNLEDFEKWIGGSHRKTKPFAEYAGVKKETVANAPAKGETAATADNAAYTITPSTYTNKKGKTSDVSLLTFDQDLTTDQERAVKEFAKERNGEGRFAPARGWKDRESGGWMFRSEEDARKAAEMVGNEEAVADNQPLTAQELRDAVEPKKPTASKNTAAKKSANRVEVADVAELKSSKPTKAERQKQGGEKKLVITDEMKHDEDILRELLGIGDDELDGGMKFRDPDAMTSQQRRFVYNAGVNYSLGYIDQGFVAFPEFAKAMVGRLGYKIKPWLKSFYEGAKRIPSYDQAMFTPTEEVDAFDVENFDKPHKSGIFAEAQMIVEEGKAQVAAEKANNELKEIRNERRKETEKQAAADTDAALIDNPQSWVGRTFVYDSGGTILKCTDIVGKYASFEDVKMHYITTNEVSKFREMLKSGMFKVQEDKPAEPQNEDIFQKAERIAKEAKAERGKKAAEEADIMATDLPYPAKEKAVKALHGSASMTDNAALAEAQRQIAKKKASKKKVEPEQPAGDLFAGLTDKKEENELERNRSSVRSQGVRTDNSRKRERGSTERNSQEVPQEGGRTDGQGESGSSRTRREVSQSNGRHVGRLQGLTEPKNTRNNHSERGEDHAPTSVNARIEANIKAIELAHELLESGETATPEQMSVLRQFSGWGGLGAAFSDRGYDWKQRERNKKIRELLGEEAYEQAVMSANSAYYTPAYVVDILWDIAERLGFKGGNILEGSAGIGNILGQMPTTVSGRSDIHAIEIDGTSGGILSLLYPDAKVDIQGFEQTRIPNGSVDLAVTNVPFVTGLRVNDTTGDSDLSKKFHNIHDFCIAKNVRKLREGGLGIFISSNGTLDSSKALRDWVVNEGGSDFIGAFRMNNKTFGGTTVTSDIIVIRKRVNGQKSAQAIDVSNISGERTAEYEEPGARKTKQLSMDYNKYFIEHPDHMAGEMRFAFEEGDTFRPTSKGLYPVSGKDQGKMLADFVKSFTEETGGSMASTESAKPSYVSDASADGKKLGEMYLKDGKLVTAGLGGYYPLEVNDKKIKGHTKQECFNAYSAIKTALADVMKYQTENEDNAGLKPLIAKLNNAYDDFVNTYGHFNKNNQLAWLRNDVDYPNVFSLETYKEQGDGKGGVVKTYGKADVMKDRVVEKESEPHPENVKDGVVVSMFKNGRIDVPYIAEQLGKSEEAVKREIIDSGLGFEDPATRQMEVSYQYLSGNVREKLRQAEANNENGEYGKNIKALQEVVPMDIPAHLIDFTLGSSWLDPKLYDEYVKDRTDIDVHFTSAGGTWFMKAPSYGTNVEKNRAMGIVSEMLKKTIMGHELIAAAIQNKSVIVSRTEKSYDGTTETITDREATAACAAKIDEIRQDFKDWARQKMQGDADLSARMEQKYNVRFNNYVPMSIPGDFVPEYFAGAIHKLTMRPHQGKAIVRGTMQPLLLAHEVGTGKTFTLVSTAMEMRRLGTARKPMIVVQNATVGQFAASAKELYPNAKILTLEDNDRNAEGRKNFYAKIKYNDWDMIVVPQSTFEFIPDSDERQMQFVKDKIDEKMLVLEKMREADSSGRDPITRRAEKELADLQAEMAALSDGISKKRTANNEKKKAVAKQNAAVKAQEMLDRRTDDVEDFDDMGIDALLIDEAHEYKHLGFATAMQRGVKGVDPSYSKKSQGVYLKTQAVLEKNNGRNVIFATGTPVSNTAAEIWTFMRYLMPKDTMKEYGIYYFDDFVRNFGNIQQMPEFGTSGKFKEVNRFAGYVNLPELVRIWSSVADTALTKDQKELVEKIPDMEGGKAQDIYLPQTRALRSVMKYVRSELDRFDQMSGKEKKENSSIPLTMYGIAQGAAVDARLVEMDAEDDPKSKTNEAVRQTLRSLKETDDYKGTVAIFADHYQNKRSGFNLYEDIKKKLIAQGVPADEVVVMKPGMTIKKKLDIFDKVNRGEVRVVLGSTATLGTGVNIQERLHTLIHLDAPNRPMDYTQRNGRILRQGNLHKQWGKPVRVLRFGVEDSLDVTAYQRLKTKGAIADSVMEGDRLMQDSMNNRVLEEEEDVFGDTVAQLSGSEYAMLKNNAEKNVRKY